MLGVEWEKGTVAAGKGGYANEEEVSEEDQRTATRS